MPHDKILRLFHIVNHGLVIVGLAYGNLQMLWISLMVYVILVMMGMNIGLHRYFAHRSFNTSKLVEKFLGICSVISTVGSPLVWVAIHRQHHRSSDQSADPHSPQHGGKIKTLLGMWNFESVDFSLSKDLMRDKFHRFLHKNYHWIILSYCALLAFINPWLIVFAYAIPACLCFWGAGLVNVYSHGSGYRNHNTTDSSTNNIINSVLTLGEGWHNNHHASPGAYKQGEKWWELDPPSWIIKLIKN